MVVWVLLALGTAVVVGCSVAAAAVGDPYRRLHFAAPVTSLGAPLVGAAAVLDTGWQLSAAWIAVIAVLVAVSGAAVQVAVGRAVDQGREGGA